MVCHILPISLSWIFSSYLYNFPLHKLYIDYFLLDKNTCRGGTGVQRWYGVAIMSQVILRIRKFIFMVLKNTLILIFLRNHFSSTSVYLCFFQSINYNMFTNIFFIFYFLYFPLQYYYGHTKVHVLLLLSSVKTHNYIITSPYLSSIVLTTVGGRFVEQR